MKHQQLKLSKDQANILHWFHHHSGLSKKNLKIEKLGTELRPITPQQSFFFIIFKSKSKKDITLSMQQLSTVRAEFTKKLKIII